MTQSVIYAEMNKYKDENNLTSSEYLLIKDFCWSLEIKYGRILNKEADK